jgi:hypothetical protein
MEKGTGQGNRKGLKYKNRLLPQRLNYAVLRDMDVFFDTEEAHAVMLAYAANGGGRAASKVTPTSLNL